MQEFSNSFLVFGRFASQLDSLRAVETWVAAPGTLFPEQPKVQQRYLDKPDGSAADLIKYQYARVGWVPMQVKGVGFGGNDGINFGVTTFGTLQQLGRDFLRNQDCVAVDDVALARMSGLDIKVGKVYGMKMGMPKNSSNPLYPLDSAGPACVTSTQTDLHKQRTSSIQV